MKPVDQPIHPIDNPCTASQPAGLDRLPDATIPVLSADYDEPDCCDYTLNQGSCWVTVGDVSIYILRTDLGVGVDVCPRGREAGETLAALYAPFPEVD